jgi:hypothetical protein
MSVLTTMGVLEITLLRIKPGIKPTDPSLLKNLRDIRAQLGTNSRFYIDTKDPSLLYIFGLWPTLEAHYTFLASPDREQILAPQEGQTEFLWGIHIGNVSSMDDLPIQAETMYVNRIACLHQWETTMEQHMLSKLDGLKTRFGKYPVLYRRRIDEAPGSIEGFIILGVGKDDNVNDAKIKSQADWDASVSEEAWQVKDLEREAELLEDT